RGADRGQRPSLPGGGSSFGSPRRRDRRDQQLLKLAAGSVQHGRLPARSGAVHALHFDPRRRFH
ncbi:unnamed protein product, partial [Effrenium voratum]